MPRVGPGGPNLAIPRLDPSAPPTDVRGDPAREGRPPAGPAGARRDRALRRAGDGRAGLLKEVQGARPADRRAIAEKMREAEHVGDEATHAIMRELNESFITPFDREHVYRLASSLDDVMDAMEAAVDLVVLYQIGDLPPEVADQVDVLERAAELTAEAIPRPRLQE